MLGGALPRPTVSLMSPRNVPLPSPCFQRSTMFAPISSTHRLSPLHQNNGMGLTSLNEPHKLTMAHLCLITHPSIAQANISNRSTLSTKPT